jgi:phosphoribosylanthranilate isomerase
LNTRVKICGVTRRLDAELAAELGADALGFNFSAESPRRISAERAGGIIARLPRRVIAVGVFVNAQPAEVLRIAREANLQMLQLHGEESPEEVRELARWYPVMKAFRVHARFDVESMKKYEVCSAYLLDAFEPERRGGTGKIFNWRIAVAAKRFGTLVLAGGLTPQNVGEAIRRVRPFAVDVASGVESRPGIKDPKKLRAFLLAVRAAEKEIR